MNALSSTVSDNHYIILKSRAYSNFFIGRCSNPDWKGRKLVNGVNYTERSSQFLFPQNRLCQNLIPPNPQHTLSKLTDMYSGSLSFSRRIINYVHRNQNNFP